MWTLLDLAILTYWGLWIVYTNQPSVPTSGLLCSDKGLDLFSWSSEWFEIQISKANFSTVFFLLQSFISPLKDSSSHVSSETCFLRECMEWHLLVMSTHSYIALRKPGLFFSQFQLFFWNIFYVFAVETLCQNVYTWAWVLVSVV